MLLTLIISVLIDTSPIDMTLMRSQLEYLASKELQGRGIGTDGIELAAAFIAATFKEYGLVPIAEDGDYFQAFESSYQCSIVTEPILTINGIPLKFQNDFYCFSISGSGKIEGEIVDAASGIVAPEIGFDNFKDKDIKDKIVLIRDELPHHWDRMPANQQYALSHYLEIRTKAATVRSLGGKALIVIVSDEKWDNTDITGNNCFDIGIPVVALRAGVLGSLKNAPNQNELSINGVIDIQRQKVSLKNVIGVLKGSNPEAKPLIIGAHYDHLGIELGSEGLKQIFYGANDNASGVVTLLNIIKFLHEANYQPLRDIYFIAFTGEETGLLGATYFVNNAPFDLTTALAMLNFDTVGKMHGDTLVVFGAGTAAEFEDMLNNFNNIDNTTQRLNLFLMKDGAGPSDQAAFYAQGIPVLHFFTGAEIGYHTPSDVADSINYEGIAVLVGFGADFIVDFDRSNPTLTFAAQKPKEHTSGGRRLYLGTIPDFTQETGGMKLAGVTPGSPAGKAGLIKDDIITKLGEFTVDNLYDLTNALQKLKAGQPVMLSYLHNGELYSVEVVLEER